MSSILLFFKQLLRRRSENRGAGGKLLQDGGVGPVPHVLQAEHHQVGRWTVQRHQPHSIVSLILINQSTPAT